MVKGRVKGRVKVRIRVKFGFPDEASDRETHLRV